MCFKIPNFVKPFLPNPNRVKNDFDTLFPFLLTIPNIFSLNLWLKNKMFKIKSWWVVYSNSAKNSIWPQNSVKITNYILKLHSKLFSFIKCIVLCVCFMYNKKAELKMSGVKTWVVYTISTTLFTINKIYFCPCEFMNLFMQYRVSKYNSNSIFKEF